MGIPGEPNEEIRATIKFFLKMKSTGYVTFTYMPFPGTEMYRQRLALKLFTPPERPEDWGWFISSLSMVKNSIIKNQKIIKSIRRMHRISNLRSFINFGLQGQFYKYLHKLRDMDVFIVRILHPVDRFKALLKFTLNGKISSR